MTTVRAALLVLISFVVSSTAIADPVPVIRGEVGNQILENIPDASDATREALRRYEYARAATFCGWLADGSMLITTQFGNSVQVHRVAGPMGARGQLTFFDDPVFTTRRSWDRTASRS